MTLYDDHPQLAELSVLHQQRVAADQQVVEARGRERLNAIRDWHDIDDLYVVAQSRWIEELQRLHR